MNDLKQAGERLCSRVRQIVEYPTPEGMQELRQIVDWYEVECIKHWFDQAPQDEGQ